MADLLEGTLLEDTLREGTLQKGALLEGTLLLAGGRRTGRRTKKQETSYHSVFALFGPSAGRPPGPSFARSWLRFTAKVGESSRSGALATPFVAEAEDPKRLP